MRAAARRLLVMVLAVLVAAGGLAACASTEEKVRGFIADHYQAAGGSGDYAVYNSGDPTNAVADEIAAAVRPGRDLNDDTGRYLGYEDVIVHVEDRAAGGSQIEVADARDGYDRWGLILVPFWGTYLGGYRRGFSGGGGGGFGK